MAFLFPNSLDVTIHCLISVFALQLQQRAAQNHSAAVSYLLFRGTVQVQEPRPSLRMPLLVTALQRVPSGYSGFALALLDACPQLAVMVAKHHSDAMCFVVRTLCRPRASSNTAAEAEVLRRLFAASPPTLAASLEPSHFHFLDLLSAPWSGRETAALLVQVLLQARPSLAFPVVPDKQSEQSLPLLHALRAGCPASVIEALLHAYPQAATATHLTTGYLPLHVAASHGCSATVLNVLLQAHPAAAATKAEEDGRYPIHCLVSSLNKDTGGGRNSFLWPVVSVVSEMASAEAAVVLVKAFPDAAAIADASGDTPLAHVLGVLAQWWLSKTTRTDRVVKQGLALLAALVRAAPAALHVVNTKGDPPLHVAAALDREEETTEFANDKARAKATLQPRHAKGGRNSSSRSRRAGLVSATPAIDTFAADAATGGLPMLLVDALLCPDPTTAAAPDAVGRLPLHIVARRLHIGPLLQRVLDAHPPAAATADNHGALPLHHLSDRRWCYDRRTTVCGPTSKGPSQLAAGKAGKCGTLAASAAAAVNTLLHVHPAAALTANAKNELPLHIALKTGGVWGTAVATALLIAPPDAAAERDAEGKLPLHVALERGCDLETVHALLDAHPGAAAERTAAGKLPLHVTLEHSGVESLHGLAIVLALLSAHPGAAAEPNAVGQLALHQALALREPCWTSTRHAASDTSKCSVMEVAKDAAETSAVSQGATADPLALVKTIFEANPKAAMVVDACGDTPLHVAMRNGRWTATTARMILNVDLSAASRPNNQGNLPLHLFAEQMASASSCALETSSLLDASSLSDILLEGYAEAAGVPNTAGELPIHLALRGGLGRAYHGGPSRAHHVAFLRRLIDAYPSSAAVADLSNNLPLHLAAQHNAITKTYVGFDKVHPDSPSAEYFTGVSPSAEIFDLPPHDDEIDDADYDDDVDVAYSGYFVSDNSENDDVAYSRYANPTNLVDEAWDDLLHTLICAYPAAVWAVNAKGQTPVHLAARNGVSLPLKDHRKALADAAAVADSNGNMPLHYAAWHGRKELVKSLLEAYQPASNHPNIFGHLPLHCVVALGSDSCVSSAMLLLEANSKAAAHQDHCGKLPIHYLCCEGPLSLTVAVLGAYPAAAAVTDNAGMLPLNYAVQHRCEAEIVRKLLIANAEAAHIPDGDMGWLPIHHAADTGNLDAVKELLAASPETALVQENHGWLPIHLAAAPGSALKAEFSFEDTRIYTTASCKLKDLLREEMSLSQEIDVQIMQALIEAAPATRNAALPPEPLAPAAAAKDRAWVLKRLPALARRQVLAEGADAASLATVSRRTAATISWHSVALGNVSVMHAAQLEDEITLARQEADAALATAEARAAHAAAVNPPPQAALEFSSLAGFTPPHLVCAACPAQQEPGYHNRVWFSDEVLAVRKLRLLLEPAVGGTQPPPSPSLPPVSACGATPLHVAAHAGAVSCIEYLLCENDSLRGVQDGQDWGKPWRQALRQQTDRGHTALHLIVRRNPPGHSAMGMHMLRSDWDDAADIPDEHGCTPRQWFEGDY